MNNNSEKPVGPCKRCNKTLRAIGTARVGGKKTHGDWSERELHKKCWKEKRAEEAAAEHIKGVLDRLENEPLSFGWSIGN